MAAFENMKEWQARIAFSMIKGMNASYARQLLDVTGCNEKELFAPEIAARCRNTKIPDELKGGVRRHELLEKARAEETFVTASGIDTLYFADSDYPMRLRDLEDAPMLLYKLGPCNLDAAHVVSIVGTRRATPYGLEMTSRIVDGLAERIDDLVVVSGLAYGIDVAAHQAALHAGVPTVAILANPLNTIYPSAHRDVAVRIVRNGGALISEYPTCVDIHKANFLARNRIVAGISDVTIVVESDARGGSLFTASMAGAYGRDVFAVPGRITDKYSSGTLKLIASNSAAIFTNVDHLIEWMGWKAKEVITEPKLAMPESLTQDERSVYEYLIAHPSSRVNEIAVGTNISVPLVRQALFNLELSEMAMTIPGGMYTALSR